MTIGTILLMITGLLIYLGVAHRVLDRLYLTEDCRNNYNCSYDNRQLF